MPPVAVARSARAASRRITARSAFRPRFASPRVTRTTRVASSDESGAEKDELGALETETSDTSPSLPDSFSLGNLISSPLFYITAGIALGVAVVQKFENAALFLSAFPIVGLTVLSKTDFGTELENTILRKRPALVAAAAVVDAERAEARRRLPQFFGPDRPLLVPRDDVPSHLKGELPGDYGFDPLGFAKDSDDDSAFSGSESKINKNLDRAVELELLHARWAMLAVVGVVLPELLADSDVLPIAEPVWWKVGAAKLAGNDVEYLGLGNFVIAGKQGIAIIALCQLVLMGGPEYARYVGIRSLEPVGVYLPGDKNYPGGAPFDPFRLADDPEFFENQRVAEIKNGRLAMVAMAGCFAQAFVTRAGPVENVRSALEGVVGRFT